MKPGGAQANVTQPRPRSPCRALDAERALVLVLDLVLVGLDVLEIEMRSADQALRSWTSSSFHEMRIVSPSLPRRSG